MNVAPVVTAASLLRRPVVKLVLAAGAAAALAAGLGGGVHAQARAAAAPARAQSRPPVFTSLSCKGSSFCLAIGTFSKPGHPDLLDLLEEWKGKTWRTLPTPPGYLTISCGGPTFCLAGTSSPKGRPRTLVWNGRTWSTFKHQPPDVSTSPASPPRSA